MVEYVPLEVDPRTLSHGELQTLFPGVTDAVSDAALIRSTLFWLRTAIAEGREPPVRGNLRTLWYRYLKPVLSELPGARLETSYTRLVVVLADLVLREGRLRYSDFDLMDDNWEYRRIGTLRPHVIVYAEQSLWMRNLRHVHEELGCTVTAWEGQPSGITSEYTARHVTEAMGAAGPVHLVGLTDYDPAGSIIMTAFRAQLESLGLQVKTNHRLITPDLWTAREVAVHAVPLRPRGLSQQSIAERWMERTGGIGGERLGISSAVAHWSRVRPALVAHVEALPGGPA